MQRTVGGNQRDPMNNENAFAVGGVCYVAVPAPKKDKCDTCCFFDEVLNKCNRLVMTGVEYGCTPEFRADGRSIVFRVEP